MEKTAVKSADSFKDNEGVDTIFVKEDYKKIRKVYSVWICTNPPVEKRNTITEYHFTEDNLYGSVKEKLVNYDLIDIIMICLDPNCEPSENYLIKLFNILKNKRLQPDEKRGI